MMHYLGVARETGITNDEIGAVQSIVMAVSAGRVGAQFREARATAALMELLQEQGIATQEKLRERMKQRRSRQKT